MKDTAKRISLHQRLKNIQKELKEIKKTLHKIPSDTGSAGIGKKAYPSLQPAYGIREKEQKKALPETDKLQKKESGAVSVTGGRYLVRDERFVDYLATNIEAAQPLRYQRRRQRNKVLALLIIITLIVLWLLGSFLYKL